VRQRAEWALVAMVTVAVLFGPPALYWIYLVAMGVYILVRGPEWLRGWLATILGTVVLAVGVIGGLVFLIG
jgi:TctA family transporter